MRASWVHCYRRLLCAGTLFILSGCLFRSTECLPPPTFHISAPAVDVQTQAILDIEPVPDEKPKTQEPQGKQDKRNGPRLTIPPELLLHGDTPPIQLPPRSKKQERAEALKKLFTELPALPALPIPEDGPVATLPELQQLALQQNPKIKQAAAQVEIAKGKFVQAGLYPNPTVGYISADMGLEGTAGQQGGWVQQTIKTARKLDLAQLAAAVDVCSAKLRLRRAQVELIAEVRQGYFSVLVASENLSITRALANFTHEVYRVQVALVEQGQAAAYEPMQVYVLAVQARGDYIKARNRYLSAWRQLVASLNEPDRPPVKLAGSADASVPVFPYEAALAQMMSRHTDLGIAHNNILKAQRNLRLAQANVVPDITAMIQVQRDNTVNPADTTAGVQAGIVIPLWNQNQGNILSARAQLSRSLEDVGRVKNDLTQQLAAAYEQYQNATILVGYYREKIIPSQVQVYRSIYQRHHREPDAINFNDIVTSQQTLAQAMLTYLQVLQTQWQAVVELSRLLQLDDMYQFGHESTQSGLPEAEDVFAPEPEKLPAPREEKPTSLPISVER